MSTEIRVALVYQQDAGTQALRTALANAGVVVALECRASALDSEAILNAEVDAIVVNLDAELEELLDEVTEALDQARQPVIYNDPAASSDLSGWDRARWMRHLSAKLKGQNNFTPPPPPGAQAIPVPAARAPEPVAVPVATVAGPSVAAAVAATSMPDSAIADAPTSAQSDTTFDLGLADLDAMFGEPAATTTSPGAGSTPTIGDDLADLDVLFEQATTVEAPAPAATAAPTIGESFTDLDALFELPVSIDAEPAPTSTATTPAATSDDFADLDALFDQPVTLQAVSEQTPAATAAPKSDDFADLDALFEQPIPVDAAPVAPTSLTIGDDLGDLDALFDAPANVEFERADRVESAAQTAASDLATTAEFDLDSLFSESAEAAPAAPSAPSAAVAPAASETELTDLDALFREFETAQARESESAPVARAASAVEPPHEPIQPRSAPLEWSLETDELAVEPTVGAGPPASSSGPAIPAQLEASLALADLKLLDDELPPSAPMDSDFADLGNLDFTSADMEPDPPSAAKPMHVDLGDELSLADFDFSLDLDQLPDEAPAATRGTPGAQTDADLGDLDSLFEPMAETPLLGLSLPDLERVFVLGASIGGPEAIKAFLGKLPASIPAAFIVAQHMGSEFLEMMALQLDAASALPVRCPKAGERLRHGEVVVAPANEQLVVDETGHVQLNAASSGSPYNPSIDQLVRAAADRFGDHATLILFSGMGSDAVEGGRYLTSRGGQVWAQERASCVIASMIDSAKSQGLIRFEGTPAQLAERVLQVVS